MAVTDQQPHTQGSQDATAPERRDPWSRPHDPETNTRPPGNGVVDERDTERSEWKLLTVVGH